MTRKFPMTLILVLLAGSLAPLAGCFEYERDYPDLRDLEDQYFPPPPNPLPDDVQRLNFTGVYIEDRPPIFRDITTGSGSLRVCASLQNPNPYPVYRSYGYEIYQVRMTGTNESLTEVMNESLQLRKTPAHVHDTVIHGFYFITHKETADGNGSMRYAIHLWHEILTLKDPTDTRNEFEISVEDVRPLSPPLREDLWFNVTHTPYSRGGLASHGDKDCFDPEYGDLTRLDADNSTVAGGKSNNTTPT